MKNFKKIIAAISVIILIALNANFMANAANITSITVNGGTTLTASQAITTIAFTPVTSLTNGSSFKVYYPSTMTDTSLVNSNITVTNANTDLTAGTIIVDTTNNVITVPVTTAGTSGSIVTLTFSANLTGPASGNIRFAVNTTDGDTGAQLVYVANSNKVAVSATVEPILKMNFTNTALDLGVLSTSANTYTPQTIAITTATNATNGLVVAMASSGLKDSIIGREIGITNIDGTITNTVATDYYKVQVKNVDHNTTASLVDTNGANMYTAAGTDMLASQNIITGGIFAAPHNNTDTIVSIGARADTLTDAGNYSDTLVFSVTGTY